MLRKKKAPTDAGWQSQRGSLLHQQALSDLANQTNA
jgi:hypothetical protein